MAQIALVLIQRAQQFIALQMAALPAFQHAGDALLQLIATTNNARYQRQFLPGQRRRGQLAQRMLQRLLGFQQPLRFAFILQRANHLRQPHRRGGDVSGITRQIHTAVHVAKRLQLHLLLQLTGMAKTENRHSGDH